MSVCAVIVSYRTGPALERCLDALGRCEGLDEIVFVDNGNDPAQTASLDAFAADRGARLLRGHGNIGFAAACNKGVALAQSEVLAFINPDVVLERDALPRLAAALATAPPPAIVGGDLRDRGGAPERGGRRDRVTLWRAFVAFSGLSRLERVIPAFRDFNRYRDPIPAAPAPVGAISGALFVMRREDFNALGGFDEAYFVHVEDLDLCRRAEEAGYRVLFAPGPHGMHVRSTSAADPRHIARYKAEGMAHYFRKFARGPVERFVARAAGAFLLAMAPPAQR